MLIAVDILLSVFVKKIYSAPIFFGINFVVCLIVAVINNRDQIKSALAAAAFPLLYIALLAFAYIMFWPWLYYRYAKDVP